MPPPRRYLPTPPTPPSPKAARVLRLIHEIADAEPNEPTSHAQKVIDLMHIHRAAYDAIDPAMYTAVRGTRSITFDRMAELAGVSRATVQVRVDNADPAKPSRIEVNREYRQRVAERDSGEGESSP